MITTVSVIPARYVDPMTNSTTSPTLNPSTIATTPQITEAILTHLDRELDDAITMMLTTGLEASVICDGSCGGVASCCVAPVGVAGTLLAA